MAHAERRCQDRIEVGERVNIAIGDVAYGFVLDSEGIGHALSLPYGLLRHEAVLREDRIPGRHDGLVDRLIRVVAVLERGERRWRLLGHELRRGGPGTARHVI